MAQWADRLLLGHHGAPEARVEIPLLRIERPIRSPKPRRETPVRSGLRGGAGRTRTCNHAVMSDRPHRRRTGGTSRRRNGAMSRPTLEVADIFPVRGEGACIGKDADGRDKPGHRGANDSVPAERARGGRWRRSPLRHLHAGALSPVERPGNRRLADHAGTRTGHVADVSVARLVDQLVDEARAGEGRSASGSRLRRSRWLHGGRTQSAARESAAPAPLRAAGPDRISDPGLTARQPGGTLPLAYRPASIVTLRDRPVPCANASRIELLRPVGKRISGDKFG